MDDRVVINLTGPDFVKSAEEVVKQLGSKFVSVLNVYELTEAGVPQLLTALNMLRWYFLSSSVVKLFPAGPLSTKSLFSVSLASGGKVLNQAVPNIFSMSGPAKQAAVTQAAINFQQQALAMQNSSTIAPRTPVVGAGDVRFKMQQEIQTKIFEMQQDLEKNKTPASMPKAKTTFVPPKDGYIRR